MVSILIWPIGNVATEVGKVESFLRAHKSDFKWEIVNMCEQVKPHFVELLQHAWQ